VCATCVNECVREQMRQTDWKNESLLHLFYFPISPPPFVYVTTYLLYLGDAVLVDHPVRLRH